MAIAYPWTPLAFPFTTVTASLSISVEPELHLQCAPHFSLLLDVNSSESSCLHISALHRTGRGFDRRLLNVFGIFAGFVLISTPNIIQADYLLRRTFGPEIQFFDRLGNL
jgi:hypothetical protein